jgi:hypothetical protein
VWLSWDSAQARSTVSPLLVRKGRSRSAKPVSELNRVIGTGGVNPRLPLHYHPFKACGLRVLSLLIECLGGQQRLECCGILE